MRFFSTRLWNGRDRALRRPAPFRRTDEWRLTAALGSSAPNRIPYKAADHDAIPPPGQRVSSDLGIVCLNSVRLRRAKSHYVQKAAKKKRPIDGSPPMGQGVQSSFPHHGGRAWDGIAILVAGDEPRFMIPSRGCGHTSRVMGSARCASSRAMGSPRGNCRCDCSPRVGKTAGDPAASPLLGTRQPGRMVRRPRRRSFRTNG